MSGAAYNSAWYMPKEEPIERVEFVAPAPIQAARIVLVRNEPNGGLISIGWIIRDAEGADQFAFSRVLFPVPIDGSWTRTTYMQGVCTLGPGLVMSFQDWTENSLSIEPMLAFDGSGEFICATLFTSGNWTASDETPDWPVNGYEAISSLPDELDIDWSYGPLMVTATLKDELPINAKWKMDAVQAPDWKQHRIVRTDWHVYADPIHITQGHELQEFHNRQPRGAVPDAVMFAGGGSNLPLGDVAYDQTGASFGHSKDATLAAGPRRCQCAARL